MPILMYISIVAMSMAMSRLMVESIADVMEAAFKDSTETGG